MEFNFRQLQKKYSVKNKHQEKEQFNDQLIFKQDLKVNPLVAQQCEKIQKDIVAYHNNNRYFYLHKDKEELNEIEKLKSDQFNQIRKQYQGTLVNSVSKKGEDQEKSPVKKKMTKKQKEERFRHYAYIFRKNVKIIIQKLRMKKITVKDIFNHELFSDVPYRFGRSIYEAVKAGEETKAWRYYIENKFVVYSVDSTKKTPLVWACIRGYATITKMLIEMGALLNKKDDLGHTALFYAIHYKNEECLKLLLLHQVEVQKEDFLESREDKRMRTIVDLARSILGSLRKMPFEKKSQFFQASLKHLH